MKPELWVRRGKTKKSFKLVKELIENSNLWALGFIHPLNLIPLPPGEGFLLSKTRVKEPGNGIGFAVYIVQVSGRNGKNGRRANTYQSIWSGNSNRSGFSTHINGTDSNGGRKSGDVDEADLVEIRLNFH